MQKFGIKKCLDNNMDYYFKNIKNIEIDDIKSEINKISSCIINYEVIDHTFIKASNAVRISLKCNINILYLKENSNDLYSHEKEILQVEYLSISTFLNGVNTKNIFLKKKYDIDIFVENISCIYINDKSIIVSYMYICAIYIVKDFAISYIMDNTIYENVYSSFYNGENLTQNTNMKDMKISKLGYQTGTKNISFIGLIEGCSDVYLCKGNNIIFNIKSIVNCESVNDYIFINKNDVIIVCKINENSYIYVLNVITKKTNVLNMDISFKNIRKLNYSSTSKDIFFISCINELNCFCKTDLNSKSEILFNHYEVMDYLIIDDNQKSILKVKKDGKEKIFLLELNNNIISPVILNIEYILIQSFLYFKNGKDDYSVLFLLKCENEMILLEYKLNTFQTKIIYSNKEITHFTVGHDSKDIFLTIKNNGFYEVLKINNLKSENILKTHSEIKEICVHSNY